jgi:hypothetical protein
MQTLIFISGVGTGAFITAIALCLCFLFGVRKSGNASREEQRIQHEESVECLRQRNSLGHQQLDCLHRIAVSMERSK